MNNQKDDSDEIMASIIGGHNSRNSNQDDITRTMSTLPNAVKSSYDLPIAPMRPVQRAELPVIQHRGRRPFALALFLIIFVGALGTVGYIKREHIMGMLLPPSPFTTEQKSAVSFPVYYPTKLPSGFKLDIDTINQPEKDVIIYVISDDSGKSINLTLQSQPSSLNLDPLYANLKDLRDIDTTFGVTKVGYSEGDNRIMANTTTGKTWIIVHMPKDTVSDAEFDALLQSLKQG